MVKAVLFDWGDTLMRFECDEELVDAGQRAGLEAIGRDSMPEAEAVTAHFRRAVPAFFWEPGTARGARVPRVGA